MILKNFFKKRAIKKAIKKQHSAVDDMLDEQMKNALKEVGETKKTIDKILKLKLMKKETREVFDELNKLDDDYHNEDEDEGEQPETFEEKIKEMLLQKIIGGVSGGMTANQNPPVPALPPSNFDVSMLDKLTPEQRKKVKETFGV